MSITLATAYVFARHSCWKISDNLFLFNSILSMAYTRKIVPCLLLHRIPVIMESFMAYGRADSKHIKHK